MKEVFKFICSQIPLFAENRVFSLLPVHRYKYRNPRAVRSWEKCNALQQETHRSAMANAMQCVGHFNGLDYFCYSEFLFCLTARELISSRLQFHTVLTAGCPSERQFQGGCTVGRDCDAVIHLLALGCPAGHNLAVG